MLNKVMLIGNLTRDPEVHKTNSGISVVNMGVAVNRKWKDNAGQIQEEVTFIDVDAWGKTADFCGQYLRKGSRLFIDGRLKLEVWDDQATRQKRSKLVVVAQSVQNLSPRDQNDQGYPHGAPPPPSQRQGQGNQSYSGNQQHQQQYQPAPPPPFPSHGQPNGYHENPAIFDCNDDDIDSIPF